MYHVVVDTTILRRDPQRRSAASRRLQQLINEGHVRLHVPEIVRREFLTGLAAEYRKHLSAAEQALERVPQDLLTQISPNTRQSVRALRKTVAENLQEEFDAWSRMSNVIVHATPADDLLAATGAPQRLRHAGPAAQLSDRSVSRT